MSFMDHNDMQDGFVMHVRVNQQGRIVIPAECRAAAGIKPGDDLIIEAVTENVKVKQDLFGELNKAIQKEALFATNTSSISVTRTSGGRRS